MKLLKQHQCVIVTGETGSGKTTQIPQWCLEYAMSCNGEDKEKKTVVCTQPRRMAAMSIAKRVAMEMDLSVGEEVGYKFRFEDVTSPDTVLKYTTDGTLLRECMNDTSLNKYQVVIIDEAHERTVTSDTLMGVIKGALRRRSDLKLVVMSATINVGKLQKYFGEEAPLLRVPGRTYPVELVYSKHHVDYLDAAVRTVIKIHSKEKIPGDILVFLTGQAEIEETCMRIERKMSRLGDDVGELMCIPLYSTQSLEDQQLIYEPTPPFGRKVVVATNIAETSLTVEGVVFVVDSGLAKQKTYNPRTRVESIKPAMISKASAEQRAGRAGRTRAGKCYRLYTEEDYGKMPDNDPPEILRSNLGSIVLQLKRFGFVDVDRFDFMDSPHPKNVKEAVGLLKNLGAIYADGHLTAVGDIMSEFPVEPQLAKTIVTSYLQYDCSEEILSVAAILSTTQSCFYGTKNQKEEANEAKEKFVHEDGDHLTLLNVYNQYKENYESEDWCRRNFLHHQTLKDVDKVRTQLAILADKIGLKRKLSAQRGSDEYYTNIKKALVSGYFMQAAHRDGSRHKYLTYEDFLEVYIHPSTSIDYSNKPEFVIYNELVKTSKTFIKTVIAVEPEWIHSIAPNYGGHGIW